MWNGGGFGDYMSLEAHRGDEAKEEGSWGKKSRREVARPRRCCWLREEWRRLMLQDCDGKGVFGVG